MFRRLAIPLLLATAVLVASLGLTRLRFDTDILSMLPGELPEVKGLKAFHEAFSRNDELILVIGGQEGDAGTLGEAAESLGQALASANLVKSARWKPRWNDDPQGIAELLAYLWLNGDAAAVRNQAERFSPERSEKTLQDSLAKVATSMEGLDMVMVAHDPFGFLDHPAVATLMNSSGHGGEAFESEDGRTQLLFVDSPTPLPGYREADAWIRKLRSTISTWQKTDGAGLTVRLTGEPAFSSEIGTAMENDLSGSIGVTLGLIGLLFWWMQRRFSLLLGLTGILIMVFAMALGIAGWIYGELSIMALSSIEILIGLAVDYGLVICQEAKVAGHDKHELRSAATKPVLFGALTTTVVFLALNLGGLPGMAQLGSIVGIGLTVAAVLMLVVYLPFVAKFGVNRQPARGSGRILPRSRRSWTITGILLAGAAAVLSIHGLPGAEFSSKIMRPRDSEAMETFEHVQRAFPAYSGKSLGVVIEAKTDAAMGQRLEEARTRLGKAEADGLVEKTTLPVGWWPAHDQQTVNRPVLAALAKDQERLVREADAAGFSEEGIALGRGVLEAVSRQTESTALVFPSSPAAREVMRLFLTRKENGGGHILGSILPAADIDPAGKDYEKFRTLAGDGIWLSGWDLFKPAISKLVREDMTRMLVPMFILLVGMMILIFRRIADVGLALFAMLVSTALLLAVMSLTGLKWNFVNLMATPLLLGTGIDYAIHVTLSLRRTGGDFKELWQGTGKALLFCGASNVIGFGSLVFSSSDALVSLGTVAVIGILLSMGTSIFLLPGWRDTNGSDGTP
ncbi:MMPL family transporter [Luteolibacter yonseiensis]|uniref:MMPL family transporter n=1 Tax=Luteolibacter yonseiensis TaxID=1144680 RepID=A0A934R4M9_9BACT|nr:MMPL family transporter [Luteolibacter yonseiensis]MBK1817076.1 MMPL family transporter [Luteolibacter yonseiensis]